MHPFILKIILILLAILNTIPALGMERQGQEPVHKKNKGAKTVNKLPSHYDMLMDAYQNKTKSKYFKKNTTICNWEDDHGVDPLERAINRGDMQECINLVAKGHPLNRELYPEHSPSEQLIHIAAKAGMYSFCKFLTRVGISLNIRITIPHTTTPLLIVTQGGHGKIIKLFLKNGASVVVDNVDHTWKIFDQLTRCQDISLADLQSLTKILAAQRALNIDMNTRICPTRHRTSAAEQHRLDTSRICVNTAEEQLKFDALALKSTLHRFHELFPLCMQLGADLETPDANGRMPLARIAYQYDMEKLALENYRHFLINMVTAYQAYLESKELPAIKTVVMIKNRQGSLLSHIPKDVFISCILSCIVPFHSKQINPCIATQLAIMKRLLTERPKLELSLSIGELSDELNPKVKQVLALFDPLHVKQHRENLLHATRELMGFKQEI